MEDMNADAGQFISLEQAKEFVDHYKNLPGSGPIRAHGFGKNKLLEIINQPNAVGARFYYGYEQLPNGTFKQNLVVIGVNSANEDIMDTNKILEFSNTCPPHCPPDQKGL